MISLQIWAVVADMLGSLVLHLAHWFIWQSHANKPSHHKLGIAHHVSIGGLFHLSPSFHIPVCGQILFCHFTFVATPMKGGGVGLNGL
jgi:hypothetical protein